MNPYNSTCFTGSMKRIQQRFGSSRPRSDGAVHLSASNARPLWISPSRACTACGKAAKVRRVRIAM